MGVDDRGVHELTLTGPVAVGERLDHGDGGQEAVAGVAERGHRPHRVTVVVQPAVHPLAAGEGGTGLIIARQRSPAGPSSKPRVWQ